MPWILNMQLNYVLIIRILTAVIRILSDRQVMFAKIGCQVLNFVSRLNVYGNFYAGGLFQISDFHTGGSTIIFRVDRSCVGVIKAYERRVYTLSFK